MTTPTTITTPVDTRRATTPQRQAVTFVLVTFAASWTIGYLAVAVLPIGVIGLGIGALVPGIVALALTRREHGTVRPLWDRIVAWRVAPRWYLAALGIPFGILMTAALIATRVGGAEPSEVGLMGALTWLPLAVVLFGGPEEPGWRGYLQPRLQHRYDALTASLIVGTIWVLWHTPLWLIPDSGFASISLPAFGALGLGASVIYTWLYNSTGGNVLLPMLLHGALNAGLNLLPDLASAWWIAAALAWAVALTLLVLHGPTDLAGTARARSATTSAPDPDRPCAPPR
jgi:uncharacterized protein